MYFSAGLIHHKSNIYFNLLLHPSLIIFQQSNLLKFVQGIFQIPFCKVEVRL